MVTSLWPAFWPTLYVRPSPNFCPVRLLGWIFNTRLTANLPRNLPVKKISKSVKIWQNYGYESVALGAPCIVPEICSRTETNTQRRSSQESGFTAVVLLARCTRLVLMPAVMDTAQPLRRSRGVSPCTTTRISSLAAETVSTCMTRSVQLWRHP